MHALTLLTQPELGLAKLPEECISYIVALTSPRDACRFGAVSSSFNSAADSDSVWSRFLPPDIDSVLARASSGTSSSPPLRFSSLKQLYFMLCHYPVLLDGRKMSFSLIRSSGKKCYMLSARALSIAWSDTPLYWKWLSVPQPESRFPVVAQLINVCWLEIQGRIDVRMLSSSTLYAAYLVFKFTAGSVGFVNQPIEVRVGLVDGEATEQTVYLDSGGRDTWLEHRRSQQRPTVRRDVMLPIPLNRDLQLQVGAHGEGSDRRCPEERGDGWLEIELGEFFCEANIDGEMEAVVSEVKQLSWKRGLIIQGIEIRPKGN